MTISTQTQTLIFPAFGGASHRVFATIRVYESGGWTVFEVAGELAWSSTRTLQDLLRGTRLADDVVVDLGRVTGLDRTMAAVLARAHRTKRVFGAQTRLVAPTDFGPAWASLSIRYVLSPRFDSVKDATA